MRHCTCRQHPHGPVDPRRHSPTSTPGYRPSLVPVCGWRSMQSVQRNATQHIARANFVCTANSSKATVQGIRGLMGRPTLPQLTMKSSRTHLQYFLRSKEGDEGGGGEVPPQAGIWILALQHSQAKPTTAHAPRDNVGVGTVGVGTGGVGPWGNGACTTTNALTSTLTSTAVTCPHQSRPCRFAFLHQSLTALISAVLGETLESETHAE